MRSILTALPLFLLLGAAAAQGSGFVFRGQLDDGAAPADGLYSLRVTLHPAPAGAGIVAGPIVLEAIPVEGGGFATALDFGPLAHGLEHGWLAVEAKAAEEADFAAIGERLPVNLKASVICPAAWALGGNAATNPAVDFLGTTDTSAFEIRTRNSRNLRLQSSNETFAGEPLTVSVIGGHRDNAANAGIRGATIAGGGVTLGDSDPDFTLEAPNRVTGHYGVIGGGYANRAGQFSVVLGGIDNDAQSIGSVIVGGSQNTAVGSGAFIGGGDSNSAGDLSVVGGGVGNIAGDVFGGNYATVGGGLGNAVLNAYATVPGGRSNCAGARGSFAAGEGAKVRPATDPDDGSACDNLASYGNDSGSFVWADGQGADFLSSGPNQFNIRAAGGVRLNGDTSQFFGATRRQMLNLSGTTYGVGVQIDTLYQRSENNFAWYRGGAHVDNALGAGGGSLLMTLTPAASASSPVGFARAQSFTSVSDRRAKTGFASVDTLDVLARVLELPLSEWSYRSAPEARHLGPMAQDFHAAFGLNGDDDTGIAMVDADGVALAAIQGLNAKLEAELAAQAARIEVLERALSRLLEEGRVDSN